MQHFGSRPQRFNFFDASGTPARLHVAGVEPLESSMRTSTSSYVHASTSAVQASFHKYVSVAVLVVFIGSLKVNGSSQDIPMVARVSIADYRGNTLLDTYVRPTHPVENYRTEETGIQHAHLSHAPRFADVQERVATIIKDKIIIGHRIWNFLSVLGLLHPAVDTRDLALFQPLRKKLKSRSIVDLDSLVHCFMGRNVRIMYEDSLEAARAAMDLFRSCENIFEGIIEDNYWPCDLPPTGYAKYYS
ncbi:hypothetical protein BDQ12DRAFT_435940 [Crucibulum laeve]|uniref:Exonuclease domain-containing protein n=1 Tax=Crucibulum laeve TaxID=68775 RepID=A0A5C3MJH2_9AGAR|nr:hypothetical protein BDQ12DRAFT_435940 [Crucibulum laeve]